MVNVGNGVLVTSVTCYSYVHDKFYHNHYYTNTYMMPGEYCMSKLHIKKLRWSKEAGKSRRKLVLCPCYIPIFQKVFAFYGLGQNLTPSKQVKKHVIYIIFLQYTNNQDLHQIWKLEKVAKFCLVDVTHFDWTVNSSSDVVNKAGNW